MSVVELEQAPRSDLREVAEAPATPGRRWPRILAGHLLRGLVVVWAAYTLTFMLLFVLPGDAVLARVGAAEIGAADLGAADLAPLREELGLGTSLAVQYGNGVLGLLTGDLGSSLVSGRPVTTLIAEALPGTAALAGFSLLVSLVGGIALAVGAVAPRRRWVRSLVAMAPAVYVSLPVFWVGIVGIYIFSLQLGWFPSSGSQGVASLILPGMVVGLLGAAQLAQVLISSLRAEVGETYAAVTAPAKGASRYHAVVRHCLRNAALPFLTVLGLRIAALLGGTVVVESVFSRGGLGRLIVESVRSVDLTVVLGVVVMLAVVYVVVNALVDLTYVLVDPRLRRRGDAGAEPRSDHVR